jgi:Transglycosylase SLT domain
VAGDGPRLGRRALGAVTRAAVRATKSARALSGGTTYVVELKLYLIVGAVVICLVLVIAVVLMVALIFVGGSSSGGGGFSCTPGSALARDIKRADRSPMRLTSLYDRAATQSELGERGVWMLAAINSIETTFGRNLGPSSAGARGWMQFMPATWRQYSVDANGDGKADWDDPEDAIMTAANYLKALLREHNGSWYRAIYGYNHSDAYVRDVMARAERYQGRCVAVAAVGGTHGSALSWALSQVGVTEHGTNRGPKIDDWQRRAGINGQPWCGAFVHEAFWQAGVDLPNDVVGTKSILSRAYNESRGFRAVEPEAIRRGDLVLVTFGNDVVEHVGMAREDFDRGSASVATVDGNSGDQVALRTRRRSEIVTGVRIVPEELPRAGRIGQQS